jgi:hypothetical protein
MIEKLPRFVEECREKWDGIAWKQIADVKYEAIHPKNGETEGKDVETMHEWQKMSKMSRPPGLWVAFYEASLHCF